MHCGATSLGGWEAELWWSVARLDRRYCTVLDILQGFFLNFPSHKSGHQALWFPLFFCLVHGGRVNSGQWYVVCGFEIGDKTRAAGTQECPTNTHHLNTITITINIYKVWNIYTAEKRWCPGQIKFL